jgi:hypothetical protein
METQTLEATQTPEEAQKDAFSEHTLEIRQRLIQLLEIYPKLSPSMIQTGLGPGRDPRLWRSILQELIKEGKITATQHAVTTPKGRSQVITLLALAPQKEAVTT